MSGITFGKPLQTPAATGTSGGKNLFSTPTPANKTGGGGGGGNGLFGSTPSAPTNATNTTSGLFANAGNTGGAPPRERLLIGREGE